MHARSLLRPLAALAWLLMASGAHAQETTAPGDESSPADPQLPAEPVGTSPASSPAAWTSQLYDQLRDRIVAIECEDSSGSGFVFHSQGHVATAFHVVSECGTVDVVREDGSSQHATIVAWDEENDLAILELDTPLRVRPLELAEARHGHVGEEVAVMGNPMGARWRQLDEDKPVWAISRGVISAPPGDLVQTDAAINPGNSGGPLLTKEGRVVGVVSFIATGAQGISFAIAGRHLAALTKRIGKQGSYSPRKLSADLGVAWLAAMDGSQSGALFLLRGLWDQTYALEFRLGRTGGLQQSRETASVTKRERWFGEITASYRLFASAAGALPVGVGLAWLHDDVEVSSFVVDVPAGCNGCSVGVTQTATTSVVERFRLVATVALDVRPIEIGGALYFLGDEDVGGRFNLGLVF